MEYDKDKVNEYTPALLCQTLYVSWFGCYELKALKVSCGPVLKKIAGSTTHDSEERKKAHFIFF